jgi:hypothetical protein
MTESQSIVLLTLNGEFIKEFPSMRKCARELNIPEQRVQGCLSGVQLRTKEYMFCYKEHYNPEVKVSYKQKLNKRKLKLGECKTVTKRNIKII